MYIGRDNLKAGRYAVLVLLAVIATVAWWGCSTLYTEKHGSSFEPFIAAMPWPEADSLFRGDKCWLGGDGAYSIDLGKNRILWLFGDSFIDSSRSGDRKNAVVIRNSLAIQQGYDPTTAGMAFYWGVLKQEEGAYFTSKDDSWFWPGGGVLAGDTLIIFLMRIEDADNELGFEAAGWAVVCISNPDSSPKEWDIAWPEAPKNDLDIIIGSAVLYMDCLLYTSPSPRDRTRSRMPSSA